MKRKNAKKKKVKEVEIKFKRIGYSEEEYEKRIPTESYKKFKEFEDYLLNLKFDNLNIYIICAGIPYGGCETVFTYFFKSAWLQSPQALPYFDTGANLIPTIHIKDLAKIVKRLITGSKPECKYIFAIDLTVDKSSKNIISSISRGIGTGKTESIEYNSNENSAILNFAPQINNFPELKTYQNHNFTVLITDNELKWKGYLGIDIMLNPSKFIDEEFEWRCKEGIPGNIPKLLQEFSGERRLRPLKIILNSSNKEVSSKYAKLLSQFYIIPIINHDRVYEMLDLNEETLTDEEKFMNERFLFLKKRLEFLDNNPDYINEANELLYDRDEIMYETFKYLLTSNDSLNRGYVMEGMPINLTEIFRLYNKKEEIIPDPDENNGDNMSEYEESMDNNDNNMDPEIKQNTSLINMSLNSHNNSNNPANNENNSAIHNQTNPDNLENIDNNINDPLDNPQQAIHTKLKKKKKIKPKVYKTVFEPSLFPGSVITICFKQGNETENHFWEVESFFQENQIEVLNLIYQENEAEMMEMMRIYIERVR